MNGTTFEFVWRIGITVLALIGLAVFWYVVLSNITPFSTTFSDADVKLEIARERRYRNLARTTVALDVLFFVWLVVEGALLVPWMVARYGI
ncbi:MAG TPA: hypothetical protein VGH89_37465 [Pseudonocardia sp.]|jgi:hypothetical protein